MFPVLVRIGSCEITSFGFMVALGAIAGAWVFERELAKRSIRSVSGVAVTALVGGLLGAKALYVAEHLGDEPLLMLVTSRAGMSWFGGLLGGAGAGLLTIHRRRLPIIRVLAAAAPGVAVGQMLGRVGCFLVGDDYGRPTDLPWGVSFPEGLPPTVDRVHPTQLYEAVFLGILAALLVAWSRKGVSDRTILARYCFMAGAFRFVLEYLRVNERVVGGLSVAQCASLALLGAGLVLALRSPGPAVGRAESIPTERE
jgi:phosphatidylglycerol:prolipoprotein diacylglycerol transferase